MLRKTLEDPEKKVNVSARAPPSRITWKLQTPKPATGLAGTRETGLDVHLTETLFLYMYLRESHLIRGPLGAWSREDGHALC